MLKLFWIFKSFTKFLFYYARNSERLFLTFTATIWLNQQTRSMVPLNHQGPTIGLVVGGTDVDYWGGHSQYHLDSVPPLWTYCNTGNRAIHYTLYSCPDSWRYFRDCCLQDVTCPVSQFECVLRWAIFIKCKICSSVDWIEFFFIFKNLP